MTTALEEAATLIYGDRHEQYGEAREEFAKVALGWAVILGLDTEQVQAEDVPLMMTWLKIVRQANSSKRDNVVDGIGYLALLGDMMEKES